MGKLSNFDISDYRQIVKSWAEARGRGEYRRLSVALSIHTSLLSQIVNGKKDLTEEQAGRFCIYAGMPPLEVDYFLKLVQLARAGTAELKEIYQRQLQTMRDKAQQISGHVPAARGLSEADRALFYSSWQYALVRLLTGIEGFQTIDVIAQRLELPASRVHEVLDFLVSRNLCQKKGEKYVRTEGNTHTEASSPMTVRHHQNWRMKSIQLYEKMNSSRDLAFTAPISISNSDIKKVREILLNAIGQISSVVEASDSKEVYYLGIDWLRV